MAALGETPVNSKLKPNVGGEINILRGARKRAKLNTDVQNAHLQNEVRKVIAEGMMEAYLTVLGLSNTKLSKEEVRKAYITLIKQWHPDKFPADAEKRKLAEAKSRALNEAYEQLLKQLGAGSGKHNPAERMHHGFTQESSSGRSSEHQFGRTKRWWFARPTQTPDWLKTSVAGMILLFGLALSGCQWDYTSAGKSARNSSSFRPIASSMTAPRKDAKPNLQFVDVESFDEKVIKSQAKPFKQPKDKKVAGASRITTHI